MTNIFIALALLGLYTINERLVVIGVAYMAAFLVPYCSAMIRRVRDTGRSFWWLTLALVPYIGRYIVWFILFLPSKD